MATLPLYYPSDCFGGVVGDEMTVCSQCDELTMDSITICNDCRRENEQEALDDRDDDHIDEAVNYFMSLDENED